MEIADDSARAFHRLVLVAAVAVHLITAWNSTGFHSADEHYQIIAFAQARLGELPKEHLPWEYEAGIRSSLQPWIAAAVFKAAAILGTVDPFIRAFLLRLLTALLALAAVHGFVQATVGQVPAHLRKPYYLLSYFLWFLPFLHVRFSSEGWSGLFLLLCITAVLRSNGPLRSWTRAGLFGGVAILCRPPVGLVLAGLLAWGLSQGKCGWRNLIQFALGGMTVLALGLLLDTIFYERFTPSTFNYVRMGFLGDPGHRFDELPWYYYAPWVVKYAIPPIGLSILVAFGALVLKRPSHMLVWCVLPFLLVHSLIPHKELRFLYPLAGLVPLILVLGFGSIAINAQATGRFASYLVLALGIVMDLMGLSVVLTSPAGEGRVALAEKLHQEVPRQESRVGYLIRPEIAWRIALPAFYRPPGMEELYIDPAAGSSGLRIDHLVAHLGEADDFAREEGLALEPLAHTASPWTERAMRWYTWNEGQEPWTLFRVSPDRR